MQNGYAIKMCEVKDLLHDAFSDFAGPTKERDFVF